MDRRTRTLFALALGVIVVLTAGAALLLGGTSNPDPEGPAGAQSVGLGSDLAPRNLIQAGDFAGLVAHARGVVTAIFGERA